MQNMGWIALNHLRLLSKDRHTYLLLLALPLALTLITGAIFAENGMESSGEVAVVTVALVDKDHSEISRYLGEALDTESTTVVRYPEAEARELVRKRELPAALIIPPAFGDHLREGKPVELTVIRADLPESPGLVEQRVAALVTRLRANAAAALLAEEAGAGYTWWDIFQRAEEKWHPSPAVEVVMERVTVTRDREIPAGHRQSSPGYVVMFGMMTVITAGAGTLLQERENGTMARLLSAPVNRFQILSGKTLGLMASGILQMAIMIAAGRLLFNVEWGRNMPALILLVAALSFASTGFGLMLASLCRTRGQAEAAGVIAVILMSMLGGTWWPAEVLPSHMQVLAKAVPSGWAMQGFVDLIMRGAGLPEVALPLLVLFAFGAAFISVGLILFGRQG